MIKGQRLGIRCLWAVPVLDRRMGREPNRRRSRVGMPCPKRFNIGPSIDSCGPEKGVSHFDWRMGWDAAQLNKLRLRARENPTPA